MLRSILALVYLARGVESICLPLLPSPSPGHPTLWGAQYSAPTIQKYKNKTDIIFGQLLAGGAKLMQLSLPWADIETTPGQPNLVLVAELLADVRAVGGIPLFNLAVIDTNRVSVPNDLADPKNPGSLRSDLNWTSPEIVSRYATMLEVIVPIVAYSGGAYFGLGNEVDVNLGNGTPEMAESFVEFLFIFRQFIQTLTAPKPLSVGATLTVGGLGAVSDSPPPWLSSLLSIADVTPLTYYPLNPDFSVKTDTATVHEEVLRAVKLLPAGACSVFQEFGVPAGYGNSSSTDHSSQSIQANFFQDFMLSLPPLLSNAGHPLRAASVFELVDMAESECLGLVPYYNVSAPAFIEYLCTLGLIKGTGEPKEAWGTVLSIVKAH